MGFLPLRAAIRLLMTVVARAYPPMHRSPLLHSADARFVSSNLRTSFDIKWGAWHSPTRATLPCVEVVQVDQRHRKQALSSRHEARDRCGRHARPAHTDDQHDIPKLVAQTHYHRRYFKIFFCSVSMRYLHFDACIRMTAETSSRDGFIAE